MNFIVRGVPQEIADEVRRTRAAPGYGHPAHQEWRAAPAPAAAACGLSTPGQEQRLLFTYRPAGSEAADGSGPVFIHAEHCEALAARRISRRLARPATGVRGPRQPAAACSELSARRRAERRSSRSQQLFGSGDADWLHLRHARGRMLHRAHRSRLRRGTGMKADSGESRSGLVDSRQRTRRPHCRGSQPGSRTLRVASVAPPRVGVAVDDRNVAAVDGRYGRLRIFLLRLAWPLAGLCCAPEIFS